MAKGIIRTYFYKKMLNYYIEQLLEHHLKRVSKKYLDKVTIRFLKDGLEKRDSSAFIKIGMDLNTGRKFNEITVQFQNLAKSADSYLIGFLNDNIIDVLRHEFAHLKFSGEGEEHQKWMKKIKLFKKDKK